MQNNTKVLVLGASGATGSLVINKLRQQKIPTKVVVRSNSSIASKVINDKNVEVIKGNVLELSSDTYTNLIQDCNVVVCCLGHNLTLKGLFGNPRKLVTDAIWNICQTIIEKGNTNYKLILMNTCGNMTAAESKSSSLVEKAIMATIKKLLPPQSDNIAAADYLREVIGNNNPKIEWVIVRPDTLINENAESQYEIFPSPIRSPLFNAGKTSRINVAAFMVELLQNQKLWDSWKHKMPVIYNKN